MSITHTIKAGNNKTRTVELTSLKAIRLHCIECMGWQANEVKDCSDTLCPLFPYRMGRNESITRPKKGEKGYQEPEGLKNFKRKSEGA